MKRLAIIAWFSAFAFAHADELHLDELGWRYRDINVEVVWKVGTNRVPKMMNVYRVVPARFSVGFISNLVALGEFKHTEQVRNALMPALKGKDVSFEEEPARKAISVSPSRGLAAFFNTRAIPLPGEVEIPPPPEEQAVKSALQIAERLGVRRSDFATNPGTNELFIGLDARERGGTVKGIYTKRIIARGVTLHRSVDGISFNGHGLSGGLYVNFGNGGRIGRLDFSWRNLELAATRPTIGQTELIRRVKQGVAVILADEFDPSTLRKLTVRDVIPFYRGYSSAEAQKWVFPFVEIAAVAEASGKEIPVTLLCPILKEELDGTAVH